MAQSWGRDSISKLHSAPLSWARAAKSTTAIRHHSDHREPKDKQESSLCYPHTRANEEERNSAREQQKEKWELHEDRHNNDRNDGDDDTNDDNDWNHRNLYQNLYSHHLILCLLSSSKLRAITVRTCFMCVFCLSNLKPCNFTVRLLEMLKYTN
jgi:hypothetical protein